MTDQMFGHQKAVAYVSDIFPKPQADVFSLCDLSEKSSNPKMFG